MKFFLATILPALVTASYKSEIIDHSDHGEHVLSARPHEYIEADDLPDAFTWGNKDGVSYLTRSVNQHIPQYCGSCWAQGSMSALADRVNIAKENAGVPNTLSVQYILNHQIGGSCYGGSASGTYSAAKKAGPIPYETCFSYLACSSDSSEGFCGNVDFNEETAAQTCRTCSTFGAGCTKIDKFPNVTIGEYGTVSGADNVKAEIFARGPVACGINAEPLLNYTGGVFEDSKIADKMTNHIISVVGWGSDEGGQHWIVRNSWGEYWGEMGYFRLRMGGNELGMEDGCSWATPDVYSVDNFPCYEGGENCGGSHSDDDTYSVEADEISILDGFHAEQYVDPSSDVDAVLRRLKAE